jgi:hypothetical protein
MTGVFKNTFKLTALLSAFVLMFSACEKIPDPADSTSFHVIADGTAAAEVKTIAEYADFYIAPGMVTPFSSLSLSEEQQRLYDKLRTTLGNFEEQIPLQTDATLYNKLLNILRLEELSYIPLTGCNVSEYQIAESAFMLKFSYFRNDAGAADHMTRINIESEQAAKTIIQTMEDSGEYNSNFEKIRYFHDYLIRNCATDSAGTPDIFSNTIYGALVNKKALCEGYAKAFSYLCNLAGIENCIVGGEINQPHMWNMVKLDGNWYHVDVTYDHPDEEIAAAHPDFVLYQFFCVSDTVIENDHTVYTSIITPPDANSGKESYYNKEGYLIENENEAMNVIGRALADAVNSGRSYATVKCATTDLYTKTAGIITADGGFDRIAAATTAVTGINAVYSISEYYEKYRILTFFIT